MEDTIRKAEMKGAICIEGLADNSDNFFVKRAFSFYSALYDLDIIIKKGFISDGASIPMVLRGIVRGTQFRYKRCYIIHDALYRSGCNRKMADLILDEALNYLGMGSYTRGKIYYGLRAFGSPSTDEDMIANACEYLQVLD